MNGGADGFKGSTQTEKVYTEEINKKCEFYKNYNVFLKREEI